MSIMVSNKLTQLLKMTVKHLYKLISKISSSQIINIKLRAESHRTLNLFNNLLLTYNLLIDENEHSLNTK